MKSSSKILFLSTLILSTMLAMSSSSWMGMWIAMEANLMSFIPLMSKNKNMFLSQGKMMYFLIQSMSSMIFIMSLIMSNMFSIVSKETLMLMVMMSMMMKMGMPPFHMWFPELMMKIDWAMCFLLMTWQKMAPMYVISTIIKMSNIIMYMICLSSFIGAMGGLNQTSTRKIMAYSSINHMGWMMACAATYKKSWTMYMLLYAMMMGIMCMIMHNYNMMYINQMNLFSPKMMDKMAIIMMMLSLGGIPPMMGFLPKWLTIQYMILTNEWMMMIVMVVSSLVTLYYYLKMISSMIMIMSHSQKWVIFISMKNKHIMYIYMVNMLLPMMILFFNF